MKIREVMSVPVVRIRPEEPVEVAARMLEHYNIGALPVCTGDGRLCGVVTDRDLVTRCLAAGSLPGETAVKQVMSTRVITVNSGMEVSAAARLMAREQIRRLPVVEAGRLCGMLSLGDLAKQSEFEAADALAEISSSLSSRG